ncbi:hypothetical protein ASPWEDRAFT_49792 [Aspergillus wentii DTO 134E9]|uniref:Oxidoreductase n=1 Tax=Aspergillus wentii DTO 134E9 TaxID=1073089 RepID=A0A1L9RYN5_ASPWE|nr:uncharacterized protein ASPWEDRAFT_49792 [Aspergillus wentii DTO 134E9]KAI9931386.1 hypothetical protein MW887_009961 [Aspergillus wentii]OJJ39947.1 hypothetical protein ASPWEDRAFT_49792 [Aspergillus wentii DTO 134E9]
MFPYKHVLLIGATAGIGRAMADRLVEAGVKVTAVGRRQDRLDEFVQKHGDDKARGVAFDMAEREKIPAFARDLMHSDIDCLFLNAGIQSPDDVGNPAFDLQQFHHQINVNFSSFVDLVHAFLPSFTQRQTPTGIIFTGSNLAIVPAARLSAYSASKAALNVFTLCLREQLRETNIKVVEVSPPPVQTELHDYMGDAGRSLGMPLDIFTTRAFEGIVSGRDQIIIGSCGPEAVFNEIVDQRRMIFTNMAQMMRDRSRSSCSAK